MEQQKRKSMWTWKQMDQNRWYHTLMPSCRLVHLYIYWLRALWVWSWSGSTFPPTNQNKMPHFSVKFHPDAHSVQQCAKPCCHFAHLWLPRRLSCQGHPSLSWSLRSLQRICPNGRRNAPGSSSLYFRYILAPKKIMDSAGFFPWKWGKANVQNVQV